MDLAWVTLLSRPTVWYCPDSLVMGRRNWGFVLPSPVPPPVGEAPTYGCRCGFNQPYAKDGFLRAAVQASGLMGVCPCLPACGSLSNRPSLPHACMSHVVPTTTTKLHLINCKHYFQTNFDFAINRYIFHNFHSISGHADFIFRTPEILPINCNFCQRLKFAINR